MKQILPLVLFITASICAFAKKDVPCNSSIQFKTTSNTGIINIPVVVHIIYNTAQQNISEAQVASQIEVLNKDYSATNDDRKNIPSYYASLAGAAGFKFQLASVDPSGYLTTGIVRKQTSIKIFGTDDRIKNSAIGGDDAWDRNKYLNIWVGNLAGGLLGYTSTVGCAPEKDGVVIQYTAFGTFAGVSAPFNLGRTTTHEVGHWLNLIHIWGDAYCGDDQVDDTPKQRASNRGMPTGEKFTCDITGHGDMYMNFMDLTDDAGMFMFTQGQCKRMRALFDNGGQRHIILSSNALAGTGITKTIETPVIAEATKVINAFPNPAQSSITIDVNSDTEAATTITIYNYIGQPVVTRMITGSRITINISSLKAGVYFIKLGKGNTATMTKFVKN
jgi:hypothetical protein